MIHSVSANQQSFHTVEFSTGLNVILADRSDASTEKDTRNGLGKSTLIEIIDFCLGSRVTKGVGLLIEPLNSWAFTLDITIGGQRVKVTRAVADANRIVIDGTTEGWVVQPDVDDESAVHFFKVERWRLLLGWSHFSLPLSDNQIQYKLSYRSLISYFIRRGSDAYMDPFRHFRQQKTWDIQLHTAYLLGLNTEYVTRLQNLKDQEEGLLAIDKAIKSGVMEGMIGSVGELETQRIQLEQHVAVAKQALDTFQVHPQYESIQQDADRLTRELHDLTNRNVLERLRLNRYRDSIEEELPQTTMSIERLYEEIGIVFPDTVKCTLEDARSFHLKILTNRRAFLDVEIDRLKNSINERENKIKDLTKERAELMLILQTHGALIEMTKLQDSFVKLQGSLELVKTRLREMKDLLTNKRNVKAAKDTLIRTAEQDHEQRRDIWSSAVRLFNEHSQALYKSPGKLVIDVCDSGFKYQVDIERSGSEGIEKMKIFCFDLTILQLQMQNKRGIDFLIHDTLMYDSVDPRQRALAFERAHNITMSFGGQYICTINSDMVPTEDFSEGFNFQRFVRLTLSDASPSGSLLGIRFERTNKL